MALAPTFNVAGIPIRPEDILFLFILIFYKKMFFTKETKKTLKILILILITSTVSICLTIFEGYIPVLGDLNTLFALARNVFIFLAGLKMGIFSQGQQTKTLLTIISIGFFISSIISIIQFYDIGGLGTFLFLMYGSEDRMEWGITRVVGVYGNPNIAAFFQICGFIAALVLFNIGSYKQRILASLLIVLTVLSVYLTFSRTGILVILLVFFVFLILEKKFKLIITIIISTIISTPFLIQILKNTRYALLDTSSSQSDLLTFSSRLDTIWMVKINSFVNNPIWGISSSKGRISNTSFSFIIFDNSYLYLLVTGGLIGLFTVMYFYLNNILVFRRFKNSVHKPIYIYIILLHLNIFLFFITADIVINVSFCTFYYLIIGLLLNYIYYDKERNSININTNS